MGITYHLIMGDHGYVERQGNFLSNLSLQPDAARYGLAMESKHDKKRYRSTICTARNYLDSCCETDLSFRSMAELSLNPPPAVSQKTWRRLLKRWGSKVQGISKLGLAEGRGLPAPAAALDPPPAGKSGDPPSLQNSN
jgi:hypothetical protein